jgi:hypothetical protein
MSRYLLVQIFKAEQESTMAKPLNKIVQIARKCCWNLLIERCSENATGYLQG